MYMVRKTVKRRSNNKTKKSKINKNMKKTKKNKVYSANHYKSNDGMLTTVWGPPLWHYLHTMSFNYPVNPTCKDKKNYKEFICHLKNVLPCGKCRKNFVHNLKSVPLNRHALKNRKNFSMWMYKMHEHINKMLRKKSGLSYNQVRERYEHFRARCTQDNKKRLLKNKTRKNKKTKKKEDGCVEPLYGKKSKCVLSIVPKESKLKTFKVDKSCKKKRVSK